MRGKAFWPGLYHNINNAEALHGKNGRPAESGDRPNKRCITGVNYALFSRNSQFRPRTTSFKRDRDSLSGTIGVACTFGQFVSFIHTACLEIEHKC